MIRLEPSGRRFGRWLDGGNSGAGFAAGEGLWVSAVGLDRPAAKGLVRATLGKSQLPEPLRVAHLIGRAIADGESRGRV